jgi:predicted NBD/HSP70 family sugar kinase
MLFVKVGRRIGAGIGSEGRFYRAALRATGSIGTIRVHWGDRKGKPDARAGSEMILRAGRQAVETGRSPFLADHLR